MILVTGATGNSGSLIVKALLRRGAKCRGLVRNPEKARDLAGLGMEIAGGDLTDAKSLDAAFRGVEKLMVISPPSDKVVELEQNAIAAAKRNSVKRIVKFSAGGADVKSPVRFGRLHGQAEQDVKASGMAWTILRPTFFMQNFLGMAGMIKSGTIYYDAGDGKAPFVDLADVADVAAQALSAPGHEGKIYEITGPVALGYSAVAALFSRAIGKPVSYANVSHEKMNDSLVKAGVPAWQAAGMNELSEAMSAGWMAQVRDTVQKVTGHAPKALEQWIQENRSAFM